MRGTSTTKFCKGTDIPKHAGNFSYSTVHYNSRQEKSYRVYYCGGQLVVGANNTPLVQLLPEAVVELAKNDPNFEEYRQQGTQPVGGKQYEAHKTLRKNMTFGTRSWRNYSFLYILTIYTDGDFDYKFPEY